MYKNFTLTIISIFIIIGCGGGGSNIDNNKTTIKSPKPEENTTIEEPIKPNEITDKMAIRFLTKATFGPTPQSVAHLKEVGIAKWLDEQFAIPKEGDGYLYTRKMLTIATQSFPSWYNKSVDDYLADNDIIPLGSSLAPYYMRSAWFDYALLAKDQLRHKMAYILSQIIVESDFDPTFIHRAEALSRYMDLLYNNAFGSYKQLLIDISHNGGMSLFLSFVGNRKVHPNKAGVLVYPDENYARELMQLFSIGVNKLKMDGTPIKDKDGNLIPTYTQEDVNNIARIFTGWELSHSPWYGCAGVFCGDFIHPTVFHAEYHDNENKTVLGNTINLGSNGAEEIKSLIDILMSQSSSAPFIAKQLIMRFVKSNPSPAYVERVATTFKTSNWNLQKTIKAIFLDPEFIDDLKNNRVMKYKEPLIAYTSFLRQMHTSHLPYLYFCNGDGSVTKYDNAFWINDPREYTGGQAPAGAKNVFNFYDNTYIPDDKAFKNEKAVAPELQIQSDTMLIRFSNKIFNDLRTWEKGSILSTYYDTSDGKVKLYESIEEYIEDSKNRHSDAICYPGGDKKLLDTQDELNVIEQVIDGDTNGDFANLTSDSSYDGDENATKALIDFVDKKFLGGMLSDKEKEEIFKPLKGTMYWEGWDSTAPGGARKNKQHQILENIVIPVIRTIVTSDAYMVE